MFHIGCFLSNIKRRKLQFSDFDAETKAAELKTRLTNGGFGQNLNWQIKLKLKEISV